jgi:hypothetical protein
MRRNRFASVLAVLALVPAASSLTACQSTAPAPALSLAKPAKIAAAAPTTRDSADDSTGAVIYIARDAAYARVERPEKIAAAWSNSAQ